MADEQARPAPGARGAARGGDDKANEASKTEAQKAAEQQQAASPTSSSSGDNGGDSGGKKDYSGADRDKGARTGSRTGGTTEAMADELDKLGVDVRLDNRVGDQRPRQTEFLKPQQVDGPEVGHFGEHHDEHADEYARLTGQDAAGDAVGMRSEGDLGRGKGVTAAGVDEHGTPYGEE